MTNTNTTPATETQIKINDRVTGLYHGAEYVGRLEAWSLSKFGPFVSIRLESPIMVYGTARDSIGFHWNRGSETETMSLLECGAEVECEYFQGHMLSHAR